MEAKVSQKGIQESMFFWLVFGMTLETLMGLRRGCDGAARDPRVGHFLQRIPQGGAILSKIIKQKQAKTAGFADLARLEPLARRILLIVANSLFF